MSARAPGRGAAGRSGSAGRRGGPGRAAGAPEQGSATVLVLGLIGVGIVLLGVLGLLLSVARARAQAQTAADLGALAAATVRYDAWATLAPCEAAAHAVVATGAVLTDCAVVGGLDRVTASVPTPVGAAAASAIAGPVDPSIRAP